MAKDKAESKKTNKKEQKVANPIKKETSSTTSKEKKKTKTTRTNYTQKTASKKSTSKEIAVSKKLSSTKKTSATSSKKTAVKEEKKNPFQVVEYYDLPYRYNQTTVKILAQTPTTLFVYWDISDKDREQYKKDFGEEFFNATKPVLIIHNQTNHTNYEVEINDFANSWYLKMTEPNCKYEIELGRRLIHPDSLKSSSKEENLTVQTLSPNQYIPISTSNSLETPNDHVLLENIHIGTKIEFRNIKTNEVTTKEYGTFTFMPNINRLFDFYKTIYKDEILEDNHKAILTNPSSSSFFK